VKNPNFPLETAAGSERRGRIRRRPFGGQKNISVPIA